MSALSCISWEQAYLHDQVISDQAKEKARQRAHDRGQEEMATRQRAKALVPRLPG